MHKNITLKVRSKSIKSARIKEVATTYDPQRAQQERVRAKDDEIRIKRRKTSRANWGSHEPATAMDSSFLEYEDDASNLGAIKRNIRRGGRGAGSQPDEDEWADDHNVRESSLMRAKRAANEDEDDDDDDEADEDDDDDDDDPPTASSRTVVLGDDDDDDDEIVPARAPQKRPRAAVDDDDED